MKPVSWIDFRQKAASLPQRILLADGEDPRIIQAAQTLHSERIVRPWLVGSRAKIENQWENLGGKMSDIECVDPSDLPDSEKKMWADEWRSIPKNKQRSAEDALTQIQDPLVLGSLYLKKGKVDGFVGGASRTTADTLRAVFNVIGLAPKTSTLFGFFLLEKKGEGGVDSLVILADCAVLPDPSPKQLCNVAIGAAAACRFFLSETPQVAFLSFSTEGSAVHPMVDHVKEALKLTREKAPDLMCEGEWQADAALDTFTAGIKGVGASPMAGKANVLIVPDLNCGNIAYKLVQRLGHVRAVGPVLWGMAQPANDLSRGCSSDDVVDMAALTAMQALAARAVPSIREMPS